MGYEVVPQLGWGTAVEFDDDFTLIVPHSKALEHWREKDAEAESVLFSLYVLPINIKLRLQRQGEQWHTNNGR